MTQGEGFSRFNKMKSGLIPYDMFCRAIDALHLYKLEDRHALLGRQAKKERSKKSPSKKARRRGLADPSPEAKSALNTWWSGKVKEFLRAGRVRMDGTIRLRDHTPGPVTMHRLGKAFPDLSMLEIGSLYMHLYPKID